MNRFLTIITLGIIATSGIIAATFEPYNRSRLFWDISSRVLTISNGGYGRVYELQNGRMVSVASTSSGYTMSFSNDKGKTWNDQKALFKARGNRHVANPEVFQMSDGTVLIGYNERPNTPYGADHPFLITLRRSTDNCETWSEPITIYTGDYVWENGCWEPIFLELPSGELQCYFSDETPFKTTNEQYIVMSRSVPFFKTIQKKTDRVALITRENLSGARVVRAFRKQDSEQQRFDAACDDLAKNAIAIGRLNAVLAPFSFLILNLHSFMLELVSKLWRNFQILKLLMLSTSFLLSKWY